MIEQDVSARLDPGLIELQRDVLRLGHPLRIKLFGMSMFPAIRPGDVAVVRPAEWTQLRRGDVALYERESRLVAHRVIVAPLDERSPLVTKGDTLSTYDPPALPAQLVGRVEAVERGGRTYSLIDGRGLWLQRLAAELSEPYSALFWKVAAARRRILRTALRFRPYRARRRKAPPLQPEIRPFRDEDLDALANCLWDLRLDLNFAQMRDWTGLKIDALREAGAVVWVLDDGRRALGVAVLTVAEDEKRAWLADLYLHPLARGFGWGERTAQRAERWARDQGAAALSCRTPVRSCAARSLFKKRGWRVSEAAGTTRPAIGFQSWDPASADVWSLPLSP
jgi:GNAT superfamily N-acetyltransferase